MAVNRLGPSPNHPCHHGVSDSPCWCHARRGTRHPMHLSRYARRAGAASLLARRRCSGNGAPPSPNAMSNRKASDAIVARPDVMRMYRIAPSNVVQLPQARIRSTGTPAKKFEGRSCQRVAHSGRMGTATVTQGTKPINDTSGNNCEFTLNDTRDCADTGRLHHV